MISMDFEVIGDGCGETSAIAQPSSIADPATADPDGGYEAVEGRANQGVL